MNPHHAYSLPSFLKNQSLELPGESHHLGCSAVSPVLLPPDSPCAASHPWPLPFCPGFLALTDIIMSNVSSEGALHRTSFILKTEKSAFKIVTHSLWLAYSQLICEYCAIVIILFYSGLPGSQHYVSHRHIHTSYIKIYFLISVSFPFFPYVLMHRDSASDHAQHLPIKTLII